MLEALVVDDSEVPLDRPDLLPDGFPVPLFRALSQGIHRADDVVHVSDLVAACDRATWLKQREPWSTTLQQAVMPVLGTALHAWIEERGGEDEGWLVEPTLRIEVDGVPLTGRPDLVDLTAGKVWDWKVTSSPPLFQPWPSHTEQIQIYRWMLAQQYPDVAWTQLVVTYIVPTDAGSKIKFLPVRKLWTDEEAERFVRRRLTTCQRLLYDAKAPIPGIPKGWEYQSGSLCWYCPVRRNCARHEGKERR